MNSEFVDRQVLSMLDSESLDRLGSSVAAIKKMKIFQEHVEISWKKYRFHEKSRFHEKVEFS